MTEKENKIAEFQEILFWQDLNRQTLLLEQDKKKRIKVDHDTLQNFCFQNSIFAKISQNSLVDNVPLVLTTDFKDLFFLDIQIKGWNDIIKKLLPGTHQLDIESALISQFEKISLYDEKYELFPDTSGEDDEELYHFIHQYNEMREDYYGGDISDIILKLHELKRAALETIFSEATSDLLPKIVDNTLFIDFENHKDWDKIHSSYTSLFCEKSRERLSSIIEDPNKIQVLKDMEILGFLGVQEGDKESIKQFKDHEYKTLSSELDLMAAFINEINNFISNKTFTFKIKKIMPFSFLANPFPAV